MPMPKTDRESIYLLVKLSFNKSYISSLGHSNESLVDEVDISASLEVPSNIETEVLDWTDKLPEDLLGGSTLISNVDDLIDAVGIIDIGELGKWVYRNTECGCWVKLVKGTDEKNFGGPLKSLGIQIGTMVDGHPAELQCDPLMFPFTLEDLHRDMSWCDEHVDEYLNEGKNE